MIVAEDTAPSDGDWTAANQRFLVAGLARLRRILERHARGELEASAEPVERKGNNLETPPSPTEAGAATPLEFIRKAFGLSAFERDLLLLSAGVELDGDFATACAAAQGDSSRAFATFGLALAVLPDAHWSALSPDAPLRRWRLVELGPNGSLTRTPMRIDERVLDFLVGVEHLDERLAELVEPFDGGGRLVDSQVEAARHASRIWAGAAGRRPLPIIQLLGDDPGGKRSLAAALCRTFGLRGFVLPLQALPSQHGDLEVFLRLWNREAVLGGCALLVDADEEGDPDRERALASLLGGVTGPLLLAGRTARRLPDRPAATMEINKPTTGERRALWREGLEHIETDTDSSADALAAQFRLSADAIHAVLGEAGAGTADGAPLAEAMWAKCRQRARPRMGGLAMRIEPKATWDDLVLPVPQRETLRTIAVHVRQRPKVYETWGFADRCARGLGVSALFAGPSGTGKTMAAEVLANELRLDLFQIDLSQVVDKYVGETEKRLARVFDAAEEGAAILLFDEADALFGKRSAEIRDSHDRYANIEISYLLQRMEAYRGLAILTTNMKGSLDTAFLRRLRFVVDFPFPDTALRTEIWRRAFPIQTPTQDLDFTRLARMNIAGGNIHNIALGAAFLAAQQGAAVSMQLITGAARAELRKLERPVSEADLP